MRSQLKQLAVVVTMTTTALVGLSATSPSAYADASSVPAISIAEVDRPNVSVEVGATRFPLCYGVIDELGNGGRACINSVTTTPATYPQTGYFATSSGHVTRCVLGKCVTTPFATLPTGIGANLNALVPSVTPLPPTIITISEVCVGSICTPNKVSVPAYRIGLLPPGSKPVTVCANGICSTPVTPVVALDSGDVLRSFALSG